MSDMFSLEGRVAFVTGASRGLGKAIANAMAKAGAHVVLAARSEGALNENAEAIRSNGGTAGVVPLDVTDENAIVDAVTQTVADTGRLDILVNNAGTVRRAPVVEVDTATHEMTRAIPTHGKISHMVLVSNDNKRLYTANITSENVSVIDRKSGELITQIPCEEGAEGMAFTPDGTQLWVANQSGESMSIIDLATHTVVERFDLPGMPVRIKFTKDGQRAYIPSWTQEGVLIVLDVPNRKEIKRVKVGALAIGVELSPDEKYAYVGCENLDGLHVVDTETLEVVKIIDTGDGPDPMAMWYPGTAE